MGHVHAPSLDDVPSQQQGSRAPAPKGPQRAEKTTRTPQGLDAPSALNEPSNTSQSSTNNNMNANSQNSDTSSTSSYSSIDLSVLINNLLEIDWN